MASNLFWITKIQNKDLSTLLHYNLRKEDYIVIVDSFSKKVIVYLKMKVNEKLVMTIGERRKMVII
jgi:hypothetical protein